MREDRQNKRPLTADRMQLPTQTGTIVVAVMLLAVVVGAACVAYWRMSQGFDALTGKPPEGSAAKPVQ